MPLSTARVHLDLNRTIGETPPLLFGGFAEHFGRCIYGGLYDPDSPHADENGLRRDVLSALRDLKISILRYPGGNFVSGYDWRDGVGARDSRPVRRDKAWKSLEPNTFGTNEYIQLCRTLHCEPMLALNLGSASVEDSVQLVEYCNGSTDTPMGRLRASHGFPDPHNVRYWCLGNEMDGPWQIGHLDARSYAEKALRAARHIKSMDARNQTVLAGSSNPEMPTYPEWDRVILEHCWESIDFLSMHDYAGNWTNDTASYLASGLRFEAHLKTIARTIRNTKTVLGSSHDVKIAWDEWNVWYKDRSADGHWTFAPHLSEEIYNLEDALVIAQWLNVFLRHCDELKIACVAQVVNAISPLLTTPTGLLKQATYYPLLMVAQHAAGDALDVRVESPEYSTTIYGDVPLLDASATFDSKRRRLSIFLVNRSATDVQPLEILCAGISDLSLTNNHQLAGRDPKAANSFEGPDRVVPQPLRPVEIKTGTARLLLPALSFTVLST
jgi:alpha-N-arabinofuranosidase